MIARLLVLCAVLVAGCSLPAEPATGPLADAVKQAIASGTRAFDHAEWNRLLAAAVKDGLVDYRVMQHERPALYAYLDRVAKADLPHLTGPELKTLLINAYNALTVRSILDHPAVASIKEIPGVWNRATHTVGGFTVTLDVIEHQLLRAVFQDPRIHFAVNCASRSCAPLPPFAYDAARLDRQLDERAVAFLTSPANVRVEHETLLLAAYFDWFGSDFKPAAVDWVRPRVRPDVQAFIDRHGGKPPVKFLAYDWSLNASRAPDPAVGGARFTPPGPAAFIALFVVLVVVMFPAGPLTLAAGAAYGTLRGTALVSVAATLGAIAAFLIARHVLRDRARRWLERWPAFGRIDRAAQHAQWSVVLVSRLSPVVPYNVLNYALGITGVRFVPYAVGSFVGMLPATLLYAAVGALSADVAVSRADLGAATVGVRVVGIAATAITIWWVARAATGKLERD